MHLVLLEHMLRRGSLLTSPVVRSARCLMPLSCSDHRCYTHDIVRPAPQVSNIASNIIYDKITHIATKKTVAYPSSLICLRRVIDIILLGRHATPIILQIPSDVQHFTKLDTLGPAITDGVHCYSFRSTLIGCIREASTLRNTENDQLRCNHLQDYPDVSKIQCIPRRPR